MLQLNLLSAEYENYESEMDATINNSMSVNNTSGSSFTSATSCKSVTIEFSRRARRTLKRKIPKKHLKKHEASKNNMTCHQFKRSDTPQSHAPDILSRSLLYEILYLALNQCGDNIQLGDLIRYLREGHLTLHNMAKFFPPNIRDTERIARHFNMASSVFPSHRFVRFSAAKQRQLFGVRLKLPDLSALCQRYCHELCLPPEIFRLIETLLMICPPEMKMKKIRNQHIPNYEGRAIAFIIFAMKLLFGLDDERERRLSASAERVNALLRQLDAPTRMLFVFTDWVKFIEMRDVLLAECHFPTAFKLDPLDNEKSHLFLDNYHSLQERDNDPDADEMEKKCATAFRNMDTIFRNVAKMHTDKSEPKTTMSHAFLPSLTPKRCALERLLNDGIMQANLYVPDFMHINHENRDVLPFLKRSPSLNETLALHKYKLKIERVPFNDNIELCPLFSRNYPEPDVSPWIDRKCVQFQLDNVTEEEWLKTVKETKATEIEKKMYVKEMLMSQCRSYLKRIEEENEEARKFKRDLRSKHEEAQKIPHEMDGNSATFSLEPPIAPLFDGLDSDDEQLKTEKNDDSITNVPFEMSNFDYWMFSGFIESLTCNSFKEIQRDLPKSFNWILQKCASIIECNERDLYFELLILENQMIYVLEQFSKMTNMLLFQERKKVKHQGSTKLIEMLKRSW